MPSYQTSAAELTAAERAEIVEEARKLDPEALSPETYAGPGRFDGESDPELASALDIISGHGFADETGGDVETLEGHGARFGRVILWTDSQGFKSVGIFSDDSEAIHAIEVAADAAAEAEGPSEEDATLSPAGPLGAQTSVSYAGKHLGIFPGDDAAEEALAAAMAEGNYWPDVWTISDHGNAERISERFYRDHPEAL